MNSLQPVPICIPLNWVTLVESSELEENIVLFEIIISLTSHSKVDIPDPVPVPLSKKRQKQRGYNQSEIFGRKIAERSNIQIDTKSLIKHKDNGTQTRRSKYERWNNVKDVYKLSTSEDLKGKHIALVDDVITTGSTLEACIVELQKVPGIKISIFTIACAN